MASDISCGLAVSPVQAAVCELIKEIVAARETRRREREETTRKTQAEAAGLRPRST